MVIARKYSDEVKEQSVRRVLERRMEEPEGKSILREVAEDFDVGVQSLRQWVAKVDDGAYDYQGAAVQKGGSRARSAPSTDELLAQIAELREDNEILRKAISVLAKRQ